MDTATGESDLQRSGHKRLRFALIVCFAAFCLAVFYVLLSAPLLLYSAKHRGVPSAHLVDVYMQPLLWVDGQLMPDYEVVGPDYPEHFHRKVLLGYYGLCGNEIQELFRSLRSEYLKNSSSEQGPFYGY